MYMSVARPYRVGEPFRPAPQFRTYSYAYLVAIAFIVLVLEAPAVLADPLVFGTFLAAPTLALILFAAYWIPLYYESIVYQLTVAEITWKRGVWFRQTGIVPYNRITNIDIMQGPVMRIFGISSLRIQTAGYSAQAQAEIRIQGIEQPEALRELIMRFVRSTTPVATEGAPEAAPRATGVDVVVQELRAIRHLLEEQVKK